jgi:hypothetical protein
MDCESKMTKALKISASCRKSVVIITLPARRAHNTTGNFFCPDRMPRVIPSLVPRVRRRSGRYLTHRPIGVGKGGSDLHETPLSDRSVRRQSLICRRNPATIHDRAIIDGQWSRNFSPGLPVRFHVSGRAPWRETMNDSPGALSPNPNRTCQSEQPKADLGSFRTAGRGFNFSHAPIRSLSARVIIEMCNTDTCTKTGPHSEGSATLANLSGSVIDL